LVVENSGPPTRRNLAWETTFVMIGFLYVGVISAVTLVTRHALGGGSPNPIPNLVPGHLAANLVFATLSYLSVASVVPIALLLLARTGQRPAILGLGLPGWSSDIWPCIGLIAATFGASFLLAIPFTSLVRNHPGLLNPVEVGHVSHYYVIYLVVLSLTTAVAEEVLVNGYLLTRLDQLGWKPWPALILSLILRTSYHVYYGLGFIFTIPFGYFMTRSFQKNRRLTRPILAHFVWDAALFTIAVLSAK